jgi:hypothetical protein
LPAKNRFATVLKTHCAAVAKTRLSGSWFDRLTMTQQSKPGHPELVEGRYERFAHRGRIPQGDAIVAFSSLPGSNHMLQQNAFTSPCKTASLPLW